MGYWREVRDGNEVAAGLYRRHYSCYRYADGRRDDPRYRNRNLILGPGYKLLLLGQNDDALFGWRKFIDRSGQRGVNCAVFRNESERLSSDLILEAEGWSWCRWPGERLYTYVDARSVASSNPGYCFQAAGWRKCGVSKKRGFLIFEKLAL